jgi:DNA-binding NarL/FixJ family response regulator
LTPLRGSPQWWAEPDSYRIESATDPENYLFGNPDHGLAAIDAFVGDLPQEATDLTDIQPAASKDGLSDREIEVLRLVAAGKSNQQIADELVISRNTVRRHVSNVFDKTGVANRAQAAVYAKEHGLA